MTITYNPNDGVYYVVQQTVVLCTGVGPIRMTFRELMEYLATRARIIEDAKKADIKS